MLDRSYCRTGRILLEAGMTCSLCRNLNQAFELRLSDFNGALSSAVPLMSDKLVASRHVELQRARYELEEHQRDCAFAAGEWALVPSMATSR